MRPSKPLLTKKPMMRLNRIGIRDRRVLVVDGGPRPHLRLRAIILSANIRAFHARIRFGLEEKLKPRKSWVSGSRRCNVDVHGKHRNRESDWGSASANSGKLRSAEAPLRATVAAS
ncbi:hypothetical protein C1H46_009804 [Malus baccata]|uniref:Uncharacterized protein n=1 Tax=Malus baccata TaxID=106549 RepID=A0A540N0N0_MALBA|nr:hypothetical protein C1H46_009804 [Malus baccata]